MSRELRARRFADGLSSPTEPSSTVSALTGFDPSRFKPNSYDGKPRHMPKAERRELEALVKACRAHIDGLTDYRLERLFKAFLSVSPINGSWQHHALAEIFVWEAASAIEARQRQDPQGLDPEGESATRRGTPKDHSNTDQVGSGERS